MKVKRYKHADGIWGFGIARYPYYKGLGTKAAYSLTILCWTWSTEPEY